MIIQVNTGSNINGGQELKNKLVNLVSADLERFSKFITRVELYLSDEDGSKDGLNDKRCLLEARLKKRQPIAVKNTGNTYELAAAGALEKLIHSLDTIIGKMLK